jgi:hypothetical protein
MERPWVRPFEAFVDPVGANANVDPPPGVVAEFVNKARRVVALHAQVITELGDVARQTRTDVVNDANRGSFRSFGVGDRVAVYRPTQSNKLKQIAASLTLQWRGPYRIVGQIASNVFRLQHELDKTTATASPANMVRFKPSTAAALEFYSRFSTGQGPRAPGPTMEALAVDTVVAVWDTETSGRSYWLGRVLSLDEEFVTVHYYGTLKPVNPVFKLVWVDGSDGSFILKESQPRGSKIAPWTGDEPRERVIMVNINLTASGALSRHPAKALEALAPAVLRVRAAQ